MHLWETSKYYELASKGSHDFDHFGMKVLKSLSKISTSILDLGCGEGTRLFYLAKGKRGMGVDISSKAVLLAKKNYPKLVFKKMDLNKLSYKNEDFDLVYSAFVLEHLKDPERVIQEAIRVTKKGGHLVLIAPNYGAPNRASPVFKGSRIKKFIQGYLMDYILPFMRVKKLNWRRVDPIDDANTYSSDTDATCEPYLGSLVFFLKNRNLRIRKWSSCWEEEIKGAKIHQLVFKMLGKMGIYPFRMWGPHLVVVAYKE